MTSFLRRLMLSTQKTAQRGPFVFFCHSGGHLNSRCVHPCSENLLSVTLNGPNEIPTNQAPKWIRFCFWKSMFFSQNFPAWKTHNTFFFVTDALGAHPFLRCQRKKKMTGLFPVPNLWKASRLQVPDGSGGEQ